MAIVTSPASPVVGDEVTITSSTNLGDVTVVSFSALPASSGISAGLLLRDVADPIVAQSAVEAAERGQESNTVTLDAPGDYTITVYQIQKLDAPQNMVNDQREYVWSLLGVDSGTIKVGSKATLGLHVPHDGKVLLEVGILDNTVTTAAVTTIPTELARVASLQPAVTAAVSSLVGQSVSTMGTNFIAGVNDLRAKFIAHIANVVSHPNADSDNEIRFTASGSIEGALFLLNTLRTAIASHVAAGSSAGSPWHNDDDLVNFPTMPPAANLAQGTVLSAELRERIYERHRGATDDFARAWSVDISGGPSYVDETADLNSAAANDVDPFPAVEEVGDYFAMGQDRPFQSIEITTGTLGTDGTVTWKYWNGASWATLTSVTDGSSGFTVGVGAPVTVSWSVPRDWKPRTISAGGNLYYVIAECASLYTINPKLSTGRILGSDVHLVADTTNALDAPSPLDNAIVALLDAFVANDPTAPATESEGLQDARHMYGFEP